MAEIDLFDLFARISIDLSDFDRGLSEASGKFKNFSDSLTKAGSGMKNLLSPAVDGFKAVESVGKKTGSTITTGLKGFAAASTAVGGFGVAAGNAGMQFDATMSKVSATVGWTTDELHDSTSQASAEFQQLRDKALEMGAKTQFSASEAADALTYMAMAGWKTDDMLGGIAGIMNLAAASGEDLATTSDIVTDALTAFGMKAEESGHFADILAKASSNSNTNVRLMGETFKYVAPVAGALGYSAEDTAIAIGLMANSGIKASSAGTALRTTLTNMAKPTDTMAAAMDQLGVSLDDGNGKMYSLGEIMDQLRVSFGTGSMSSAEFNDKLSELNDGLESGKYTQESYDQALKELTSSMYGVEGAQKAELAAALAGKEGMSGLLAIVSAAPEDYEKLTKAIYDCNGAAEQMAATMVDNLQGDLTLLGSAFESLQIAISDSLTPTLREFAQFGQTAMANLLEGFQSGGTAGLMDALSTVITDILTMLAEKAPAFAEVSMQFIGALGEGFINAAPQILESAGTVITTLTTGLSEFLNAHSTEIAEIGMSVIETVATGFSGAADVITQHIGEFIPLLAEGFATYHETLFTVGIDILGAIGQGIIENKEEIGTIASETIANMVTALQENAPEIIEGGIALMEALVKAIEENLPLILETGVQIIGELVAGISTASPELQAIIAVAILPKILEIVSAVGGIGTAFTQVIPAVKAAGTAISGVFALLTANPIGLVIAAIVALVAAFVALWNNCEGFRNFWIGLWDGIKSVVGGAIDVIISLLSGLVDGIGSVLSGLADFIGGVFSSAWDLAKGAWDAAGGFFSDLWDGIKEGAAESWDRTKDVISKAWDGVKSAWDAAGGFFSDLWGDIKQGASDSWERTKQAGTDAWEAIQNNWEKSSNFFSEVWEGICNAFSGVVDFFGGIFSKAWDAVTSAFSGVTDFFGGVLENILGVFGGVWDSFLDIGGNIVQGIWDGISGAWNSFVTWLGNQVGGLVNAVKGMLGIHSPSRVFAGIGENMALGLGEGWDDEYSAIKRKIESGMDFGIANVKLSASALNAGGNGHGVQNDWQRPVSQGGDTFNFYSPKALDPVSAAREMRKAKQQMALGYV